MEREMRGAPLGGGERSVQRESCNLSALRSTQGSPVRLWGVRPPEQLLHSLYSILLTILIDCSLYFSSVIIIISHLEVCSQILSFYYYIIMFKLLLHKYYFIFLRNFSRKCCNSFNLVQGGWPHPDHFMYCLINNCFS